MGVVELTKARFTRINGFDECRLIWCNKLTSIYVEP